MAFSIFGGAARREREQALREVERLRAETEFKTSVMDVVPTPVLSIDRNFRITYINEAGAKAAGRLADECIGQACYDLLKTTHCRTSECRCAQAMETGRPLVGETVASLPGGDLAVRYSCGPLYDEQGKVSGAVEYVLDMTQEIKVTEAIIAARDRALVGWLDDRADGAALEGNNGSVVDSVNGILEALVGHINIMPSPVLVVDREFNVRFVNDAAASVVGATSEQMRGRKCHELFKAEDCGTSRCALARAMASGKVEMSETVARPGDTELYLSYSGVPIRDAAGEIVGAMEVVVDQTQTEMALRDSSEKVEYLNAVPTPVIVIDRDFTVRFVNPAAAAALGRPVSACVGEKCHSMFNTGDCRTSKCAVARAMQTDTVVTSDTVASLPGGELPIRYTGCALKDENGNIIGGLEYVLDISKEMEITTELGGLAEAAIDGKLDSRADVDRFEGNYRTIVEGVNRTIEALIEPIAEAADVLEQVAQRRLDVRVTGDYRGDHAKIKENLNQAVENLDQSLAQVAEATEQVTSAANQISAGSQSLAEGANEQSSSLEEVSASLEEMSSMTRQNAGNAEEAKGLAVTAKESAERGVQVREDMAEAMDRIKSSSDETAKIIKTIDEIAFQTNLLALNAAVEAARAGEAGKGFAVVAEEVRNLAQRSAEAAKVTADMIESSQRSAEDGVKTAQEVGRILAEITEGASKVNEITAEIAAASAEQAKGIDQVNIAIAQTSKVTQQNAANSEESASAAEELSSQAEELLNMVATFELSERLRTAISATPPNRGASVAPAVVSVEPGAHAGGNGNGNGNGKRAVTAGALRPQAVIPLDEDEELDF